jgi:patatin-like phospholipase/acyl hydrolase
MGELFPTQRTKALNTVLQEEFKSDTFDSLKKLVGVVATSLDERKVKIFKSSNLMAQGRKESFVPAWGFSIVDSLMASCAATPFFKKAQLINNKEGINFCLMDGGFSANNPTLFALIDALRALKLEKDDLRVLNVGTGDFPYRLSPQIICSGCMHFFSRNFISEILDISSNTTGVITQYLLEDIKILRISDSFTQPALKTNLLENDKIKLAKLFDQGKVSFGKKESEFDKLFLGI